MCTSKTYIRDKNGVIICFLILPIGLHMTVDVSTSRLVEPKQRGRLILKQQDLHCLVSNVETFGAVAIQRHYPMFAKDVCKVSVEEVELYHTWINSFPDFMEKQYNMFLR